MVDEQLVGRGALDERILAAFRTVPRHLFVPAALRPAAYNPVPLPIGFKATISQPAAIAATLAAADIQPDDIVLDIGCGSGYQAALAAQLGKFVYGVEIVPELAERSIQTLADLNIANVEVRTGDGTDGWPEHAPFDAILVAAAARDVPPKLREQLAEGGRLVMPVGAAIPRWWKYAWLVSRRKHGLQRLVRVVRRQDEFERHDLGRVDYVPLQGAFAPRSDPMA